MEKDINEEKLLILIRKKRIVSVKINYIEDEAENTNDIQKSKDLEDLVESLLSEEWHELDIELRQLIFEDKVYEDNMDGRNEWWDDYVLMDFVYEILLDIRINEYFEKRKKELEED